MASNPFQTLPKDLLEDLEFQNYVKANLAIVSLRDALIAPTEQVMKYVWTEKIQPGETCTQCTAANIKGSKGMSPRCAICLPRMQFIMGQAGKHGEVKAQINWSNSDPRKWSTHYWEVAKCFLGPGQKDSSGPKTTDCANIITLWLNCCKLTQLCANKQLLEDVRVSRNKLMHSSQAMRQSREEMAAVFDSIKALLNDEKLSHNTNIDCQAAIAELDSIRNKTSVKFSELKGNLLDDLMKEHLRAELANTYLAHYAKLQPVPWRNITLPINLIYQKQTLKGKEDDWRQHACSSEIKRIFEPSEESGPMPERVLIDGMPGMGKTTLCQRLLESWALGVRGSLPTPTEPTSKPASHDELESSRLHEYLLVFFLRVRELDEEGLVNNLLSNLVEDSWRDDEERLKRCIRDNIKQVLLLIDGYDEGDEEQKKFVDRWLTGRECRGSMMIVTSRPGFCRLSPPPDTTYTLEGLDQIKQRSYAQRFDELMGGELGENSVAEQLKKLPFQHLDFLQYPLMLALVCFLARQGQSVLPQSVTKLYGMFFKFMSGKAMRGPINFSEEYLSKLKLLLQTVAFDLFGLKKSEMTSQILSKHLSKSEINKTMTDLCKLGLVCQESNLKGLINNQTGTFLHQSFLDYFAARHFVSLSEEERSALLGKIAVNENMLVFVAGLCGESEEHRECFRQMMEAWKRGAERELEEKGEFYPIDHSVLHACLLWVGELHDPAWLRAYYVTDINQTLGGINWNCSASCLHGVTALVRCAAQHHDSLSSHSAQQCPSPLQETSTALTRQRLSLSIHDLLKLRLSYCEPSAISALHDLLHLTLPPNVKLTCKRLTLSDCLTGDECERLGAVLPLLTNLEHLQITMSSLTALNAVLRGFKSTSRLQHLIVRRSRCSPRDSHVIAADPWSPPDELLSNISRLSELQKIKLWDLQDTLTTEKKIEITQRLKERLPPNVEVTIRDTDALWKDSD